MSNNPTATTEAEVCVQCEANARYNEAGGYKELAEKCRQYCRNGHKEVTEASGRGEARTPTAAEVLGLLTVHLLQEHWDEAREIANEIRVDFATNPARPIAIDFMSTHDAEAARLREALERLLECSACTNGCAPDDMTCATNFARTALNSTREGEE